MPRFSLNVSPSIVSYIERCATKAINCLTQKESLDAADIQAINEMLKLADFPYNEFELPKKNFQ